MMVFVTMVVKFWFHKYVEFIVKLNNIIGLGSSCTVLLVSKVTVHSGVLVWWCMDLYTSCNYIYVCL